MKKLYSLILLFTILVSGCSQDEMLKEQPSSSESLIFTASFENKTTRTFLNEEEHLRWNANDLISVFAANTYNQKYEFQGETGANSGDFEAVTGSSYPTGNVLSCHYAIYPYNSSTTITENGVITATLPAEQSYAVKSFGLGANTMVAATADKNDHFLKFKNVGGYLELLLYGDNVTVKSITLTGNNNEKLAGTATITSTYSGDPTISMSNEATKNITLDCGEGIKIGTSTETATAFWLVVPPTTFESGFTITVTDINGGKFTKSTSKKMVIERNVIQPMNAFEVEIVETIPNNQIWYTTTDGKILTFTNRPSLGATITSHTYIDGKGVIECDGDITRIGYANFSSYSNIKKIILPNSVTSIGNMAFYRCESLEKIVIPNKVTEMGNNVFRGCISLSKIVLPENLTKINENMFLDCRALTEITIPTHVETIGDGAFLDCKILKTITIPENVKTIGTNAFADCESFTEVIIPENVESIGRYVFLNCKNLQTIKFKNDVVSIGEGAFSGCSRLTDIVLPNQLRTIGKGMFNNCEALTEITIPSTVTSIGESAFNNCYRLEKLYCKPINPPSLLGDLVFNLVYFMTIYVPTNSKKLYENATGWNDYPIQTMTFSK